MAAFEADLERFNGYNAQVLGISVDSVPCKAAWAQSLGGINYDMVSDFEPKGEVAKKYEVYRDDLGFSERAVFVVDKQGKIAYKKIYDLPVQPDNAEVLEALRNLS